MTKDDILEFIKVPENLIKDRIKSLSKEDRYFLMSFNHSEHNLCYGLNIECIDCILGNLHDCGRELKSIIDKVNESENDSKNDVSTFDDDFIL